MVAEALTVFPPSDGRSLSTACKACIRRDGYGRARVKGILKAELKRKGLSYRDLAEKLAEIGVKHTELNIKNKISRGGFTAAFFVQCLVSIGCQTVRLED